MKTQLTIDLRAVAYARYYYKNQFGEAVRIKPKVPTIHGGCKIPNALICNSEETMFEYATRLGLIDRWTPVCVYQFRNSHSIQFTGARAKAKWKEYNGHIYRKAKKAKS